MKIKTLIVSTIFSFIFVQVSRADAPYAVRCETIDRASLNGYITALWAGNTGGNSALSAIQITKADGSSTTPFIHLRDSVDIQNATNSRGLSDAGKAQLSTAQLAFATQSYVKITCDYGRVGGIFVTNDHPQN